MLFFLTQNQPLKTQNVSSFRSYTPKKKLIKNCTKRDENFSIQGSNGILEFALIYDEINQLLLVNVLRARVREGLPKKSSCSFGFCPNYLNPHPLPPPLNLDNLYHFFFNANVPKNLGMGSPPPSPSPN